MTASDIQLRHFHGGLHLPANKVVSTSQPVRRVPLPSRLVLPLQQHIGEPATPLVKIGDRVLKGQRIARAEGFVSVPSHAPSSGTVVDIGERPVPHPSGLGMTCIVIETDGKDKWIEAEGGIPDFTALDPSELRNRVRDAGIVGLGGAGFPSFIKMNPGPGRKVDLLIINGAECEPYISCDDMLMRERPDEILGGIAILLHALQAERCLIGIEDNKPAAIASLHAELRRQGDARIQLVELPTLYPTGGERQLIQLLTGMEVPAQGLPADIGVVCHNPGTVTAIYRAIFRREPLISRIVTVTGQGVAAPCNLEAPIGTPVSALIKDCGGYTSAVDRLIIGGPMMGYSLTTDAVPVIKTTNCLLAATPHELPHPKAPLPCIRCGECTEVCPANLLPQQLYWYAHARDFDKAQDYSLFDCIECGCCAYVCPSHIPLVQYYRFAKTEIWAQERERQRADLARQRHEFRLERIERDKRERAERLSKKKKALKEPSAGGTDPRAAAIQAALERVKARKAAAAVAPKNTDELSPEQQRMIAEVDERRQAARKRAGPETGAE
jgi:electron transport complex protein RnfC